MNTIPNGVIPDPRTPEQKSKDYLHPTAGAVTPNWVEKTTFKRFKQRNQDGSFSCVFQAGAKALEVLTGKVISATPYFWRKNYPNEGSYLQDMGDVMYNRYSCQESASPSQKQNEVQMNTIKPLTTNIGCTGYRTIQDPKNIELIAEAIEAYGQCVLVIGSNSDEYTVTPIYNGQPTEFGHGICAVDYCLQNGVKTLIIEDSAGQWSSADGVRFFTENWLKQRCYGAMYFLGAKDVSVPQDKFIFKKDMGLGSWNSDVKELQKRLGVIQTGFYWTLTRDAVRKYQVANGIPSSGFCGVLTRASLNK